MTTATDMNSGEVRVLPQNLEAEQSVIGAMLLSPEACAEGLRMLRETDFYREINRKLFMACKALVGRQENVDMITLTNELNRTGDLDVVGGVSGLTSLVERVPTAANMEYYSKIVREKSVSRSVIGFCTKIVGDAYADRKTATELLHQVQVLARKCVEGASTFRDYDDSMASLVNRVKSLLKDNWEGKRDWYVRTGFERFDRLIGGLERKKLILITGDEGVGKSSIIQQIAVQVAQYAIPVGYVCLDTGTEELPLRLACNWAKVDYRTLGSRDPQVMSEKRRDDVLDALDMVRDLSSLHIVGQEHIGFNFDAFEDWARQRVREKSLKAILVDSVAKFDLHEGRGETERAMTHMVNRLKFLAEDLDVAIVTIHETSQSEAKNPKHSGSWKFGPRYWFHLERSENDGNIIRARIRKNNNGPRDYLLQFRQVGQFKLIEVDPDKAAAVKPAPEEDGGGD